MTVPSDRKRLSSASCSDGGRHEPVQLSCGAAAPRRSRASACRSCSPTSAPPAANPICSRMLREEILAVIAKHVNLDPDKVQVKLERGNAFATLEVDIEVPNWFGMALAKSA